MRSKSLILPRGKGTESHNGMTPGGGDYRVQPRVCRHTQIAVGLQKSHTLNLKRDDGLLEKVKFKLRPEG